MKSEEEDEAAKLRRLINRLFIREETLFRLIRLFLESEMMNDSIIKTMLQPPKSILLLVIKQQLEEQWHVQLLSNLHLT